MTDDLSHRLRSGETAWARTRLNEAADRIEALERQLADAEADRDAVERQLALCQKQFAVVEGQATSRLVQVEEQRTEIATLSRQLAETLSVLEQLAGGEPNGRWAQEEARAALSQASSQPQPSAPAPR